MYIYIMIYVYVCMIMFTDLVRFPQILKYLYIIHIWFPRVDVLVPLCLLVLEALMDKYGDKDLVDDLIARKTEANLFVANPDFPGNQDLNPHVICLMGFKFKIAPQFYKIQFGDHPMAGLEGVLVLGRHGGNRQEFKGPIPPLLHLLVWSMELLRSLWRPIPNDVRYLLWFWHRTRGACPCFFSWGMILSLLVHHKDIWPFPLEILLRQPRSPKPNLLPNLDRKSRKPRLPNKKRPKFLGYIMYYAKTWLYTFSHCILSPEYQMLLWGNNQNIIDLMCQSLRRSI